jgi:dolichol kinase
MEQIIRIDAGRQSHRWSTELQTEVIRKGIHLLIALVPTLASWNYGLTIALLGSGIIVYAYCEMMRMAGYEILIISRVTALAARNRDSGKYVMGPVTLGLGALLALTLYPEPAASIAIYALAFGDGLSSLVGRAIGSIRIPHTGGKSIEGSLTCFIAVSSTTYSLTGRPQSSLLIALIATIIEAIPSKDLDNLLLPGLTGLAAIIILAL